MSLKNKFYKHIVLFLFAVLFLSIFSLQYVKSDEADKLPVVIQELVKPPFVPTHNILLQKGPQINQS